MDLDWISVGAALTVGAVVIGFPVGLVAGYAWRDRISRARRARYSTAQRVRKQRQTIEFDAAALAPRDDPC